MRKILLKILLGLLIAGVLLGAWIAFDLYKPHKVDIRDFDVKRAAQLELEWWIVHRQRKQYKEGDLARALAETAAEVYKLPVEDFIEHGNLRAEAMNIRDNQAEAGGVTEEDWQKIDELLHQSWRSLHAAVNQK
jgi:hypothetical protein